MALLHQATISPSKLEMISAYLPSQPYARDETNFAVAGSYRFDDPAGAVGIETHLVTTASATTFHLPLTYRASPLDGAEHWLLGEMEHSVLGQRWVYNGCGDQVYVDELVRTMFTGGSHVPLMVETPDGLVEREPNARVRGRGEPGATMPATSTFSAAADGTSTRISAGEFTVVVHHVPHADVPDTSKATLTGTWDAIDKPAVLAYAY